MVTISPISALSCNQPTIKTKKYTNLPPLKNDTVSFGNAQKVAVVGTDAILDMMRKCTDLLRDGKKEIVKELSNKNR